MALGDIQERYLARENSFYRMHYHHILLGLIGLIILALVALGMTFYQMTHRPMPQFSAEQANGKRMELTYSEEPNLLPDTILRWASKAAVTSYTFDFANVDTQIALARPFYTANGWQDYLNSVRGVLSTIVQNQLFVYSVVSGTPVIANQGPLPDTGYVWRIQIPFIVTYQSANISTKRNFYVIISIVHVPTNINPQGIGIDQFVMR